METFRDIVGFLRDRKRFWMVPLVVMLVLLSLLIALASSTALGPFIYTLF